MGLNVSINVGPRKTNIPKMINDINSNDMDVSLPSITVDVPKSNVETVDISLDPTQANSGQAYVDFLLKQNEYYKEMLDNARKRYKDYNDPTINAAVNNYESGEKNGTEALMIAGYIVNYRSMFYGRLGLTKDEVDKLSDEELAKLIIEYDDNARAIYEGANSDSIDEIMQSFGFDNYETFKREKQEYENLMAGLGILIHNTEQAAIEAKYAIIRQEEGYTAFDGSDIALPNNSKLNKIAENNLDPELIKTYKYIYATKGEEAAKEYLEDMKDHMNNIIGKYKAECFLNGLPSNGNVLSIILDHIFTIYKGMSDGIQIYGEGIANWFTHSGVNSINEYEIMYITKWLEEKGYLLNHTYNIFQSIGDAAPSVILALVTCATAGTISMGLSAGGNAYHGALVDGYSTSSAILYGLISGTSEAVLEKVLGGLPGIGNVDVVSLRKLALSMVNEGIEEGTQEYFDALVRSGLFGENFDFKEVSQDAATSAIYGAIVGGIMNSPKIVQIMKVANEVNKYNSDYINQFGDMKVDTILSKEEIYQALSDKISESDFDLLCDILKEQGTSIEEFYAKQAAIVNQRLDSSISDEMSEEIVAKLKKENLEVVNKAIVNMANELKNVNSETWVQVQETLDYGIRDDLNKETKEN